jgi:nicotinamide-nucleotide amidase
MSAPTTDEIRALAVRLGELALARRVMVASAESCTGGLVAAAITDIAGSSGWFERGYVSYSNRSKIEQLGVDPEIIARHGAVSEQTARAMAEGARAASGAQWAVSVTGIAGPGGASPGKPVGTVWFAWAGPATVEPLHRLLGGDRSAVRGASVVIALQGLVERLA